MVASACRRADSFLSRGVGLLLSRRLEAGQGLLITRTGSITMLFMRFAIDAVFIDRSGRVVRAAERVWPWTPVIAARGAAAVIELPVGTIARTGTQAGDDIRVE